MERVVYYNKTENEKGERKCYPRIATVQVFLDLAHL